MDLYRGELYNSRCSRKGLRHLQQRFLRMRLHQTIHESEFSGTVRA